MPNVCGIENYVFVESPNIAQSTRVLAKNRSISFLPEGPVNTVGLQVREGFQKNVKKSGLLLGNWEKGWY